MRLEHVNLTVSDLDRSVAFYRELRVRWRGTLSSGLDGAHVGDDAAYLALFQVAESGRVDNAYDRVGLNHFGFVVDDLDAMKLRLASLGVEPHSEQDYEPGWRLYFFDPDGVEGKRHVARSARHPRPSGWGVTSGLGRKGPFCNTKRARPRRFAPVSLMRSS